MQSKAADDLRADNTHNSVWMSTRQYCYSNNTRAVSDVWTPGIGFLKLLQCQEENSKTNQSDEKNCFGDICRLFVNMGSPIWKKLKVCQTADRSMRIFLYRDQETLTGLDYTGESFAENTDDVHFIPNVNRARKSDRCYLYSVRA